MTDFNTLTLVVFLLFVHWVGDYVLQTRKQGNTKHTDILQLFYHVQTYSLFLIAMLFVGNLTNFMGQLNPLNILIYGTMNFLLHFTTDFFTSRAVKRLWENKQEYQTFVVMGLDQFIHVISLLATLQFLC